MPQLLHTKRQRARLKIDLPAGVEALTDLANQVAVARGVLRALIGPCTPRMSADGRSISRLRGRARGSADRSGPLAIAASRIARLVPDDPSAQSGPGKALLFKIAISNSRFLAEPATGGAGSRPVIISQTRSLFCVRAPVLSRHST